MFGIGEFVLLGRDILSEVSTFQRTSVPSSSSVTKPKQNDPALKVGNTTVCSNKANH